MNNTAEGKAFYLRMTVLIALVCCLDIKRDIQNLAEVSIDGIGVIVESSSILRTDSGKRIYTFLGIPYGESDRFEKPRLKKPSNQKRIIHADQYVDCVQVCTMSIDMFPMHGINGVY